MWRIGAIACLALAPAASALAEFRTNMDVAPALQAIPPAPPGYANADQAARAVRKGQVAHRVTPDSAPESVLLQEDMVYAVRDGRGLRADVYRPRNAGLPAPILVFVHGGAWDHGSEDAFRAWGIHFAQRGYVCAAVTYRLVPLGSYPAAIEDVREALRWIQTRAGDWNADAARMALIGQSAGAHLALMTAYQASDAPRIRAVVDFYGPVDLTERPLRTSQAVRKFLSGRRFRQFPDLYREASPLSHVSGQCPPTLIFHGTVDNRVSVKQSDALAEALRREEVPFWYDRIDGWHHAMDLYAEVNAHCLSVMDVFFDRTLASAGP